MSYLSKSLIAGLLAAAVSMPALAMEQKFEGYAGTVDIPNKQVVMSPEAIAAMKANLKEGHAYSADLTDGQKAILVKRGGVVRVLLKNPVKKIKQKYRETKKRVVQFTKMTTPFASVSSAVAEPALAKTMPKYQEEQLELVSDKK